MQELNLGTLKVPINAASKTFAILAKRGAGKSYTGAVMAEEFHKNNIPFVVFDPIDVWWGLKLDKDGKSKGLPVVVFGIEHADIKIDRDMGRQIARAVVKHNISCVISTFGLPKVAQRHLIAEFSDEILNINNTPRHIFIEEAHEYVPQRILPGLGVCFNAVSNLVVMGRNRGLGVTLINQRASTINKDVLTQLDTLIAMRLVAPQDRKALKEWVEYHSAEGDFEKFMESLGSLPTGDAWVWSPEFMGIFERIKIRQRETFHPDREKLGEQFQMPELERADVQEFIKEFKNEIKKEPTKQEVKKQIVEEKRDNQELISIRNEYESKLLQKDLEIRKRDDLINSIRKMLGVNEQNIVVSNVKSGNLQLWLDKFKNSGEGKILKLLAENSSNSFSRQQLVLMTGLSRESVRVYVGKLKTSLTIKEEDGKLKVNPDL